MGWDAHEEGGYDDAQTAAQYSLAGRNSMAVNEAVESELGKGRIERLLAVEQ